MKIAVIDNYDSFVYNIIHYLQSFDGVEVDVFFNDGFILEQLENYDKKFLFYLLLDDINVQNKDHQF
mgnify:CR=1 FL=1